MKYFYIICAVIAEVTATSALKPTNNFTKFWPTLVVIIFYSIAFYFLTLSLKSFSISVAYAIWSGAGIVLISIVGYFLYDQKLDLAALIGIGLIIAGVVIINLFSKNNQL